MTCGAQPKRETQGPLLSTGFKNVKMRTAEHEAKCKTHFIEGETEAQCHDASTERGWDSASDSLAPLA